MKEKLIKFFTNKIFIYSSIALLVIGAIVGVSFAWVGRTDSSELQATVSKILVDSYYSQVVDSLSIDKIMPGDEISGEISVKLSEESRNAYIRVKLTLDIDRERAEGFEMSAEQEKWLKEVNFNLCETHTAASYRWSSYRGGFYYLLKNSSQEDKDNEIMLPVTHSTNQGNPMILTRAVEVDFDSNMLFTNEHGDPVPFVLKIETQAIQSENLKFELDGTEKSDRIKIGQIMNDAIGEQVQESYIITFDSDGGTPVRSVTVPFLDSSLSTDHKGQYTKDENGLYCALTDVTMPQDPTKPDKVFGGWYVRVQNGLPYKFVPSGPDKTKITSDMTLYAVWKDGFNVRLRFALGEESHGVVLQSDSRVIKNEDNEGTYTLPYYVYNGMELVWFDTFDLEEDSITQVAKTGAEQQEGDVKVFRAGDTVTITQDTIFYGAWYYIDRGYTLTSNHRTRVATILECEYKKVYDLRNKIHLYNIPVSVVVEDTNATLYGIYMEHKTNIAASPYLSFYSIDIFKGIYAKLASVEELGGDRYKVSFRDIKTSIEGSGTLLPSTFIEDTEPFGSDSCFRLPYEDEDPAPTPTDGKYFTQSKQPNVNDAIYLETTVNYKFSTEASGATHRVTFTNNKGVLIGASSGHILPNEVDGKQVEYLIYKTFNGEILIRASLKPENENEMVGEIVFELNIDSQNNMSIKYNIPGGVTHNWEYTGYVRNSELKDIQDTAFTFSATSLTGYLGKYESILLPSTYEDGTKKNITATSQNVFMGRQELKRVVVPNTYSKIGAGTFSGCVNLETLALGAEINEFEIEVFKDCKKLTSITIPKGTTKIAYGAFSGCESISEITYNATTHFDFVENNGIFTNVGKATTGIDIYIGNEVTHIPAYFMCSLTNETASLKNPNVANVYARSGSVDKEYYEGVKTIGTKAFYKNTNLLRMYFSTCENLELIGESAFEGCTSLNFADLPKLRGGKQLIVEAKAFKGTTSLKSVDFGLGVYSIGDYAYNGCGLITISLPASVNSVGNFAFLNCTSTTSLSLMAGVGSLQTTSFTGLSNCTSVYIDSDFTAVIGTGPSDKGVFDQMGAAAHKPVDFVFGNNVKKIIARMTKNNHINIGSITLGTSVEEVGEAAFAGCETLETLIINSKAQKLDIKESAFEGCVALKELTIPFNVTEIGSRAFAGCRNLEKLNFNAVSCISEGTDVFARYANGENIEDVGGSSISMEVTIGELVEYLPKNFLTATNINNRPYVNKIVFNASNFTASNVTDEKNAIFSLIHRKSRPEVIIGDNVKTVPAYLFYSGVYLKSGSTTVEVYYGDPDYSEGLTKTSIHITSLVIGEKVETIEKYAFFGLEATQINMGTAVTTIGNYAFYASNKLINLALRDAVKNIGAYAFYGCSKLLQVTIGEGVKLIGEKAFGGMDLLQRIYFNAVNCGTSEGGNIFENAGSGSPAGTSLVFGSRVQIIPQYLINSNSTKITTVQISNSVIRIGKYAFAECSSIKNVKMGGGVQEIEEAAFKNCGLTSLVLPTSLIKIENNAFYNCFNIELIEFNSEECQDFAANNTIFQRRPNESTIGCVQATLVIGSTVRRLPKYFIVSENANDGTGRVYSAYINRVIINSMNLQTPDSIVSPLEGIGKDISSGATVTFSDSVISIPSYLFNNASISSLYIGRSVVTIGDGAFSDCAMLKTVTFSQAIEKIGAYAFNNCVLMRNTNDFPEYVSEIGAYAFNKCENLSISLYLTGVQEIKEYSFYGTGLKELYVGENVTLIERGAFAECNYLSYVVFRAKKCSYGVTNDIDPKVFVCSSTYVYRKLYVEETVEFIPWYFMADIKNLSYVYFNPRKLDAAGMYAFKGSGVFVESYKLVFGDYVTRVPDNLFAGTKNETTGKIEASGITDIELTQNITIIGANSFAYCTRLTELPITTSVIQILDRAFIGCSSLKRITLPVSVEYVGSRAFADCTAAESITLGVNLTTIGKEAFLNCVNVFLTTVNSERIQDFTYEHNVFGNLGKNLGGGGTLVFTSTVLLIPEYFMSVYSGAYDAAITTCLGASCPIHKCVEAQPHAPNIKTVNIMEGCALVSKFAFACNPNIETVSVPGSVSDTDITAFYHLSNGTIDRSTEIRLRGKLRLEDGSDYENGKIVVIHFDADTYGTAFKDFTAQNGEVKSAVYSHSSSDQTGTPVFKADGFDLFVTPLIDDDGYFAMRVYRIGQITSAFQIPKQIVQDVVVDSLNLNGLFNVVAIGEYGFYDTSLTSISIPEGVKTIGGHAFESCELLNAITLPTTTTALGARAFYGCSAVTSLTLSTNISSIGSECFANLYNLTLLNYATDSIADGSEKSLIFSNMGISSPNGTEVKFAINVTKIPKFLFYNSLGYDVNAKLGIKISSISFSEKITIIPEGAFYGCGGFTTLTLPNVITNIDKSAFENVVHLRTVASFGNALGYIGEAAFKKAPLTEVNLPSTVKTIGVEAFAENTSLTKISLPNSITTLSDKAFFNCVKVSNLSYNVVDISSYTDGQTPFGNLGTSSSSNKVVFESSVVSVPDGLFRGSNAKITSLEFKGSTSTIGSYAFSDVFGLTSVTLPGGVKTVKSHAFHDCHDLVYLDLGSTVESIGSEAFANTKVQNLVITEHITSLEEYAFGGMNYVKTVRYCATNFTGNTIYEGTDIRVYSIFDTSLGSTNGTASVSVTIASNVQSIPNLFMNEITTIKQLTFEGAGGTSTALTTIGGYAFAKTEITSITIPRNVKTINEGAFSQIETLTSITVDASNMDDFAPTAAVFKGVGSTGVSVVFTDAVTRIPGYMFADFTGGLSTNISSISMGSGVRVIGRAAFIGTVSNTITIPLSVTTIEPLAFAMMKINTLNYNAQSIPNLSSPEYNIFYKSFELTDIIIGEGVLSIPDYMFAQAAIDEAAYTPENINAIIDALVKVEEEEEEEEDGGWFDDIFGGGSDDDEEIEVTPPVDPSTFTYLDSKLNSLTISSTVRSIGKYAFASNSTENAKINLLTYKSSNSFDLTSDATPFVNRGIEKLVFHSGVTHIPAHLFYANGDGQVSIIEFNIPENVTKIGENAFVNVKNTLKVEYSARTISSYENPSASNPFKGFGDGEDDTKVIINSTVTRLVDYFMYGANIRTVVFNYGLNAQISSIGSYAFAGIPTLETVAFSGLTPPATIGTEVFGEKSLPDSAEEENPEPPPGTAILRVPGSTMPEEDNNGDLGGGSGGEIIITYPPGGISEAEWKTYELDSETDMPIHPGTGYLVETNSGYLYHPDGYLINPTTNVTYDLKKGWEYDPDTGMIKDPETGKWIDPTAVNDREKSVYEIAFPIYIVQYYIDENFAAEFLS